MRCRSLKTCNFSNGTRRFCLYNEFYAIFMNTTKEMEIYFLSDYIASTYIYVE